MGSQMGVKWSGDGLEGMFDNVMQEASDQIHESLAEEVATKVRAAGLTTADDVELDIESDEIEIDYERVRARANEILRGR
jgi:hypothetical protein